LANHFTEQGHSVRLLRGEQAVWPGPIQARECISFSTGADLAAKLKSFATAEAIAVFHAAAVADFTCEKIWRRSAAGKLEPVSEGKIKTGEGSILVELTPVPKIISQLRTWFPSGLLIGWKYEVEGGRETVLALARKQILENRTDACVANGPGFGPGFGLVTAGGTVTDAPDFKLLFQAFDAMIASMRR
jgi:phosphopantothenoylcysteine decarboxylase/phosphopantothenate--cysteine ligase